MLVNEKNKNDGTPSCSDNTRPSSSSGTAVAISNSLVDNVPPVYDTVNDLSSPPQYSEEYTPTDVYEDEITSTVSTSSHSSSPWYESDEPFSYQSYYWENFLGNIAFSSMMTHHLDTCCLGFDDVYLANHTTPSFVHPDILSISGRIPTTPVPHLPLINTGNLRGLWNLAWKPLQISKAIFSGALSGFATACIPEYLREGPVRTARTMYQFFITAIDYNPFSFLIKADLRDIIPGLEHSFACSDMSYELRCLIPTRVYGVRRVSPCPGMYMVSFHCSLYVESLYAVRVLFVDDAPIRATIDYAPGSFNLAYSIPPFRLIQATFEQFLGPAAGMLLDKPYCMTGFETISCIPIYQKFRSFFDVSSRMVCTLNPDPAFRSLFIDHVVDEPQWCRFHLHDELLERLKAYRPGQADLMDSLFKRLVGIETNPGPLTTQDYDSEKYANLSKKNAARNRKACRRKRFDAPPRKTSRSHSHIPIKVPFGDWQGHSGYGIPLNHSLNPEQFSTITEISSTLSDISSKLEMLPGDQGELQELVKDLSQRFGKGVTTGVLSELPIGKADIDPSVLGTQFAQSAVTGGIQTLVELIKTFVDKISCGRPKVAFALFSSSLLLYLHKSEYSRNTLATAGCIMSIVAHAMFSDVPFMTRIEKAFSLLTSESVVSMEGHAAQLSDVVDACSAILFTTMFPKTKISIKKVCEFFRDFGNVQRSVESVVSFVIRIVQRALDYVCEKLGYKSFAILASTHAEINSWIERVRGLLDQVSKDQVSRDRSLHVSIMDLEDEAYSIMSTLQGAREQITVASYIRPMVVRLAGLREMLENAGVWMDKTRQAPLMIFFSGISQIGKSRLLRPFAQALVEAVGDENMRKRAKENFDSIVYSRQPEHKFWDGYFGQLICFFDEFNIVATKLLTEDNSCMDAIRMGNVFPNVLHMAGMAEKGNTYFRSTIVIATSNAHDVYEGAQAAVSHPEAVVNRFHFEATVCVSEEYATQETLDIGDPLHYALDKKKLRSAEFDWNVHRIHLRHRRPIPNQVEQFEYVTGEVLTLEEFLAKCVVKYRQLHGESLVYGADGDNAREKGKTLYENFAAEKIDNTMEGQAGEAPAMSEINLRLLVEHGDMGMRLAHAYMNTPAKYTPSVSDFNFAREAYGLPKHEWCDNTALLCSKVGDRIVAGVEDLDAMLAFLETHNVVFKGSEAFWRKVDLAVKIILGKLEDVAYHFKGLFARVMDFLGGISVEGWVVIAGSALFVGVAIKTILGYFAPVPEKSHEPPENKGSLMQAHAGDPMLVDVWQKVWNKNYYRVSSATQNYGYAFFMHSEALVIVAHFIALWKTREIDNDILFSSVGSDYKFKIPAKNLIEAATPYRPDLVMCRIPSVRKHPDIRSLLVPAEMLQKRGRGDMFGVTMRNGAVHTYQSSYQIEKDMPYNVGLKEQISCFVPATIKYKSQNTFGDCGGPIFIVDPTTRSQKFVGVHVAGSRSLGIGAAALFANCNFPIEKAHKEEAPGSVTLDEIEFDGHSARDFLPSTMREIGRLERPVPSPGLSKIRKSPLYGAWGPAKKAPSILRRVIRDGESVDPLANALKRFERPIFDFDERKVDVCVEAAVSDYVSCIRRRGLKLAKIEFEEAVEGIHGHDFKNGLPRTTSAGYPLSQESHPGYKGKQYWLGKDGQRPQDAPGYQDLKTLVDTARTKLEEGERPDFYYTISLKDELLKHAKIDAVKTRIFTGCPLVMLVLFVEYFGDFFSGVMETRLENESAVGINVYSAEWDFLARKHASSEGDIGAGDFGGFDISQEALVLKGIGKWIIANMDDSEHSLARTILWKEIWNSRHVVGSLIIEWLRALPSGNPGTTIINTIYVSSVFRMCWVTAHNEDLTSIRTFTLHVRLTAYGDDHQYNVIGPVRSIFNERTMPELMAKNGMDYTMENKTETAVSDFRPITDITFLKRSYRFEPIVGRYVAPLSMETILEMPYWSKKEFYHEICQTNFHTALRELALHGDSVFDTWAPIMLKAARERLNLVPMVTSREFLLLESCDLDLKY